MTFPSTVFVPGTTITHQWLNAVNDVCNNTQDYVSVKSFGAVGDGVTDDTTAIQNALNSSASRVYIPEGNYLISSLNVPSNIIICGDGYSSKLSATGLGNIFELTNVSNVVIDSLHLKGLNNATSNVNGAGINATSTSQVVVKNCYLDSFGSPTDAGGIAIHFYNGNTDITIENNEIVNGIGDTNSNDIEVYANSGYVIITNNRAYSPNSAGIYTNATSAVGRIIISNNISKNHKRHGILPVYGGTNEYMDAIVSNNICQDCDSTGIYVNSNASGFVVTGNIVESCTGGGKNGYYISGGIVLIGSGKKVCVGNYINNSGKTTAGVTRTIDPSTGEANNPLLSTAIRINYSDGTIVSNNIIKGSTGSGIDVYLPSKLVQIHDNQIENCAAQGIYVGSPFANNQIVLSFKNNVIDQSSADGNGIFYVGSSANTDHLEIVYNTMIGKKAGTNKAGLYLAGGGGFTGSVYNNTVKNWDVGIDAVTDEVTQRFGIDCIVDSNQCISNTIGFRYIPPELTKCAFYSNMLYLNNGTDEQDLYGYNTLKQAISILPKKVFYATAAPTAATWAVGDRAIKQNPVVGQPKSWVCTVAGTPGTWVSEGNL